MARGAKRVGDNDVTNHSTEESPKGMSLMEEEKICREDSANTEMPALCCSLGLGVYGNGSKHDISPVASGNIPVSNDSPAAQ